MEAYGFSLRGCIFGLLSVVLAIGMTVASVNYQRPADPVCYGNLGAGFPVSFLCDATGGSPTSNWAKIDAPDWVALNPLTGLVDILFYTVLFWIAWRSVLRFSRLVRRGWE